jgi:DNA-3-methyladenine glycosylase I
LPVGDGKPRCAWARTPASIAYHDREWGTPSHDDRVLFEFLILEGAQAGLSWETILAKRDNYRAAFADFDVERVAAFDARDVARLLSDAGIVRNRLKVGAAIENARAILSLRAETGATLAAYFWAFVNGEPIVNRPASPADVPASTPLSAAISKDLRRRGFRFVGPTIVYAFMQAVGIVDDHLTTCFRATIATRCVSPSSRAAPRSTCTRVPR